MNFIETENGLVNLAFVESIQRCRDGRALIKTADNSSIATIKYDDIEELLAPVIPNTSSSQALFMDIEDGVVQHRLVPIIAWRLTYAGASPIVPSGDDCDYVLHPDGRVEQPFMAIFDSLDHAKEDFLLRNRA